MPQKNHSKPKEELQRVFGEAMSMRFSKGSGFRVGWTAWAQSTKSEGLDKLQRYAQELMLTHIQMKQAASHKVGLPTSAMLIMFYEHSNPRFLVIP